MNRWVGRVVAGAAVSIASLGVAPFVGMTGVASAQTYGPAPTGAGAVTVSGNLVPGGTITITITGLPNTTYEVVLFTTPFVLGTITTNSSGVGSGTFTIPCTVPPGSHSIVVARAGTPVSSLSPSQGAAVTVASSSACSSSAVTPSSSSSLPFTGADVGITAGAGAALIGGGGILVLTVRKRRHKDWGDAA